MESKIPIPTDNIYKFYALFGLVLFISCIAAFLYVNSSTNELIFSAVPEYKALEAIEHPTAFETTKKQFIEKRVEVAIADRKFLEIVIGAILGISILLIGYGFRRWHSQVQPLQDETARLQLEKLRLEIDELKGKTSKKRLCGGRHHAKMRK